MASRQRAARIASTLRTARAAAIGCALFAASACGTSRVHFAPAERAIAQSPDGFPAAEYAIGAAGRRWGEVRVWCSGAEAREGSIDTQTVVSLGFEIENATDTTLELDIDLTRIEALRAAGHELESRGPDPALIDAAVQPHSVRQVDLDFSMPGVVEPDDLDAFRIRWLLRGPDEHPYEQFTAFVRMQRYPAYPPHWYDPWFWRWTWGPYW